MNNDDLIKLEIDSFADEAEELDEDEKYYKNLTVSQSWRGIQALGWDDNNPFICLPSKLGSSSSTTYFGTNMYGPIGNNDYVARSKVYSSHATNTNLITSVFDYTYSSATNTTTSRLIKYEN